MGFTNRNKAIAVARDKADWRRLVNSSILPEESQDSDDDDGLFPLTKHFGKFLLGLSVWEERVPFLTSPIRSQAPLCRFTKRPDHPPFLLKNEGAMRGQAA